MEKGIKVDLFQQDINHLLEPYITQKIERGGYDFVGLGFVAGYYQYQKAKKIAEAVNRADNRSGFKFLLGGHGPAADPEYFMKLLEADAVFVGDAEDSLVKYVTGQGDSSSPSGVIHPIPPAISAMSDDSPWPAYDSFPIEVYSRTMWPTSKPHDLCMPILSGRGCPYQCTFCYRMEPGKFLPRSPDAIIDEMSYLHLDYRINHFQFSDELFMSSTERVERFCERILEREFAKDRPGVKWDCSGRLNFAKPKTLRLMKRAGCEYVNYGCEAMDDQVLRNLNKGLTVRRIREGVKATLEAGLSPGLNFIWGSPGDTPNTLIAATKFLLANDLCHELRTIRPVTPYPGSELFNEAVRRGLLKNTADFYENKHVNSDLLTVNFTDLSDVQFHAYLKIANKALIKNYYEKTKKRVLRAANQLYSGDASFRGFRPV